MNIYDIAKLAGVSTATVSRVINGGKVSERTKARVNAVLADTGYTPSPYAQAMNAVSPKLIGILACDLTDLYYLQAIATLEEEFRKLDYDIILYSVDREMTGLARHLDSLCARRVDAIFAVGSVFHKAQDCLKTDAGIPIITVNLRTEGDYCYHVFCDEQDATRLAVHTLYRRGHRSFLYLNDTNTVNGAAKLTGFRCGLAECGLGADAGHAVNCPRSMDAAQKTAIKELTARPQITAVLTSVDELAVGTVKAAAELGKRIPQELAVIGFDNSVLSECSTPRISTIDNRVADLCKAGVAVFCELKSGNPVPRDHILDCHLVEKETT